MEPFVRLKGVSKSFLNVHALRNVSVDFLPGEVHVIMGENGAGKSTLIKIISGIYKRDSGEIFVAGNSTEFKGVADSMVAGISVIHQELSVIPDLSVAENIFLGREFRLGKSNLIDRKKMRSEAQRVLDSMSMDVQPQRLVRQLSTAQQQMVEIARAVSQNASMVIMDEPTSSLSEKETQSLFRVVDVLKQNNVSIVYISHRMNEIRQIGDRLTILRDGQWILTTMLDQITDNELIASMVGREITQFYYKAQNAVKDEIVLKVSGMSRRPAFTGVSFELRRGEILGFAGLIGAGRTELVRAIFGADKVDEGHCEVFGQRVNFRSPSDAISQGIGLVPEDRRVQGLLLSKTIKQNASIVSLRENSNNGFIRFSWETANAREYMEVLKIKAPNENTPAKNLSGGNQQKVVLAKWLAAKSKILFMDEPTRGIDVNAKAEIYLLMKEFVEAGGSIIMVSSELPEILGVSDRILVMREGVITGELAGPETTEEDIMQLASYNSTDNERGETA